MNVLCFVEREDELSAQAIGFARALGEVRTVTFEGPYQPAAWANALAAQDADAIVAAGSDRGNELLAHVGAVLDRPFAANVTAIDGDAVTRQRWGGSLLEEARLHGSPQLLTVAPHTQPAAEIGDVETLTADDDASPKVLQGSARRSLVAARDADARTETRPRTTTADPRPRSLRAPSLRRTIIMSSASSRVRLPHCWELSGRTRDSRPGGADIGATPRGGGVSARVAGPPEPA